MRRSELEIKEFHKILDVMRRCDTCRLALNDGGTPYIVPLNFGFEVTDGRVTLYFHSALEGKKLDLLRQDNRAGFEMDCSQKLITGDMACKYTMEFESVVGKGLLSELPEHQRITGLNAIMRQYGGEGLPYNQAVIPKTMVLKLEVTELTGKHHFK